MSEADTLVAPSGRRPRRRTVLLTATLVTTATAACPGFAGNGPYPGSVPATPPPAVDNACTEAQKADAGVVKCCLHVSQPETQRMCSVDERAQPNRCCPE